MEACNFGQAKIVELLLEVPQIDLEAVDLRGRRAEDIAASRGFDNLTMAIRSAKAERENPEELPRIRQLEQQIEQLKRDTRHRLGLEREKREMELRDMKTEHEIEIEPLSTRIDSLQVELEEAMKKRYGCNFQFRQ